MLLSLKVLCFLLLLLRFWQKLFAELPVVGLMPLLSACSMLPPPPLGYTRHCVCNSGVPLGKGLLRFFDAASSSSFSVTEMLSLRDEWGQVIFPEACFSLLFAVWVKDILVLSNGSLGPVFTGDQ